MMAVDKKQEKDEIRRGVFNAKEKDMIEQALRCHNFHKFLEEDVDDLREKLSKM